MRRVLLASSGARVFATVYLVLLHVFIAVLLYNSAMSSHGAPGAAEVSEAH